MRRARKTTSRSGLRESAPREPAADSICRVRANRLTAAARILRDAQKKLPVLKMIAWSPEVRSRFFARGARELPNPKYQEFDPRQALGLAKEARGLCRGDAAIERWLQRSASVVEDTAVMISKAGTAAFSRRAQKLYGSPSDCLPGTRVTPVDLARRLTRSQKLVSRNMPAPPDPHLSAQEVAKQVRAAVKAHFGAQAPEVCVVEGLAARAAAAPSRIRIRKGAKFSDLDIRQLIHHEAYVHVATSLNGRAQRRAPLLAASHAGTTRTQEGLAVFAELISGALDPSRLLRIAHRVEAVQMALDGADFLQVYRYHQEHALNDVEAYESTVRIFRGGLVRGGSPFTKDIVYLDGLCRVHVFLRAAIYQGRVDCAPLLFSGKLDLKDVHAVAELRRIGLCSAPRFVPPWIEDPRRLVAYLSVTEVIGRAGTAGMRRHYADQLQETPTID